MMKLKLKYLAERGEACKPQNTIITLKEMVAVWGCFDAGGIGALKK